MKRSLQPQQMKPSMIALLLVSSVVETIGLASPGWRETLVGESSPVWHAVGFATYDNTMPYEYFVFLAFQFLITCEGYQAMDF